MTHSEATYVLLVTVTISFTLIGTIAIRVMLRSKDQGKKASIVPVLLPTAILILGIALTHVLLGGQLGGPERRGLWGEGTLIALPTSLATLAGTFISLWAVLWTAERALRETRTQIAESRRHRVTRLIRLFDELEEASERINREWFMESARRAHRLEKEIREVWDELVRELKTTPRDVENNECSYGHTIWLPEINLFLPDDEYGSLDDLGCIHFRELLSKRLQHLYRRATQLAANKFSATVNLRSIIDEIKPLLRDVGLDSRKLLKDAAFFSLIYPRTPPDPKTAEGRYALASILSWVHCIHWDEDWDFQYERRARQCDINVEKLPSDWCQEEWQLVQKASSARKQLQNTLRHLRDDEALGAGSELDFWIQVARHAGLSETPTPHHAADKPGASVASGG